MDFLVLLALAFFAGLLVKIVDWLDDVRKAPLWVKIPPAMVYGVLIGYLIASAPFSVIFLAALLAQVFARKVDTHAHRIGFVIAALSLIYLGFPSFDLVLLGAFLLLAFLDEIDFVGFLRPLNDLRPFLKIGALAPAVVGNWSYFAGIISFDIGYLLVAKIIEEPQKSGPAPKPGKAPKARYGKRATRNP
ncbi:MAG: hypothetical protein V1827_00970 [Candidatus Micrarchaeota archaeon]